MLGEEKNLFLTNGHRVGEQDGATPHLASHRTPASSARAETVLAHFKPQTFRFQAREAHYRQDGDLNR